MYIYMYICILTIHIYIYILGIGLYVLFIEKWLEHFPPDQFLLLRLEDFKINPQAYMEKVFSFLDLKEPDEHVWTSVLTEKHANAHHGDREPLLLETEELLRDFYKPYNDLLAKLTGELQMYIYGYI
jgi:N-acetylgalactosamine 4-sulfate 6-O-sulfotransferase